MAEALEQLREQLAENFNGETTIYSLYESFINPNDNGGNELKYPLDLGEDYKASVKFTPKRRVPVDIGGLFGGIVDDLKSFTGRGALLLRLADVLNTEELDPDNTENIRTLARDENINLAGITDDDLKEVATAFKEGGETTFNRDFLGLEDVASSEFPGPCEIYLMQALQFRDNIAYNNLNLGLLGGQAANVLSRTGSGEGVVKGALGAIANITKATLGNGANPDMARVGTVLASSLAGTQVQGAVRQLTRTSIAPNARTQFEAPNIRDFQFTFRFVPTSVREAETVQRIIKFFRYHMYPTKIPSGGGVEFPLGYNFPDLFDIKLRYNKRDMNDTNLKILPCYLISCDVNYNQTAMGFHEDGKFNEVEMALNFREEKALSREDVEEQAKQANIIEEPYENYIDPLGQD